MCLRPPAGQDTWETHIEPQQTSHMTWVSGQGNIPEGGDSVFIETSYRPLHLQLRPANTNRNTLLFKMQTRIMETGADLSLLRTTCHSCCRTWPGSPGGRPEKCGVGTSGWSLCSLLTHPVHRWQTLSEGWHMNLTELCFLWILFGPYTAEVVAHDDVHQVARPAAQLHKRSAFILRPHCTLTTYGVRVTLEAAQSTQPLAHGSTLIRTKPSTKPGSFSWKKTTKFSQKEKCEE